MADDGKPLKREARRPNEARDAIMEIARARRQGSGQLIRLQRLPGKGWTGGVCAGIAYRLGCRPALVRVIFVATTLTLCLGPAVYLPLRLFLRSARRVPKDFDLRIGNFKTPDSEE